MNALKKLVYIASGEHKKPGEQRWDNVAEPCCSSVR